MNGEGAFSALAHASLEGLHAQAPGHPDVPEFRAALTRVEPCNDNRMKTLLQSVPCADAREPALRRATCAYGDRQGAMSLVTLAQWAGQ